MNKLSRRSFLTGAVSATCSMRLASIASGLPLAFLWSGRAHASSAPKTVIFGSSSQGESTSPYSPGAYEEGSLVLHPDPAKLSGAAYNKVIGGTQFSAADLRNTMDIDTVSGGTVKYPTIFRCLPGNMIDHMHFVHYRTNRGVHFNYPEVMTGNAQLKSANGRGSEQLPACLAQELAGLLQTTLDTPLVLGGGTLTSNGNSLARHSPLGIKNAFQRDVGTADMTKIRNKVIDSIYRSSELTANQSEFLDRYVQSGEQAKTLGENLSVALEGINDNSMESQLTTACVAAKFGLAPVICVKYEYSGDNHDDPDFANETPLTLNQFGRYHHLWETANSLNVLDDILFATADVFGSQLGREGKRGHNGGISTGILFGTHLKGGVSGEIDISASSRRAGSCTGINTVTGKALDADVDALDTMMCYYKTVLTLAGVPENRVNVRVPNVDYLKNV